jgi:DNA-directed RNA polymerase specialized sigma24 family protein
MWGSSDGVLVCAMEEKAITKWIDELSDGNQQAAQQLWQQICLRLLAFSRLKLDEQTRRLYDENDAANSAFYSLCCGLTDGRLKAENRDALWGLLSVITTRKISAQRRFLNRQKRGGGMERGESGFAEYGDIGINAIGSNQQTPDVLVEVSESCDQLLDALSDQTMKKIVLLKFQGVTNVEVAGVLKCTQRTVERKLERIRRIWVDAGLHDGRER